MSPFERTPIDHIGVLRIAALAVFLARSSLTGVIRLLAREVREVRPGMLELEGGNVGTAEQQLSAGVLQAHTYPAEHHFAWKRRHCGRVHVPKGFDLICICTQYSEAEQMASHSTSRGIS